MIFDRDAGLDLAGRAVGGSVVAASDESFGVKERLIDPAEPSFLPGTFDLRGEVVDGWETRRHAPDGDWAVIRLGVPGRLRTVDVDTRFFTGNHPTGCVLHGATLAAGADPCHAGADWRPLAPLTPLKPDAHNPISIADRRRYTHLKLAIASDGGVARLRAYGDAVPDPALWSGVTVEVSGAEQGGRVEHCSDAFYSDARAVIAADRPHNMGAGWEARRRRDIGPDTHDAVTISFLAPTDLDRIEIDTSYFVFNASREVCVRGTQDHPGPGRPWWALSFDEVVLPRTRLIPDARQVFVVAAAAITAIRVQAYPDGGIARVRALGRPTEAGLRQLRDRWEAAL
ncbi:allantoicase [Mycobacterium sp. CVI_P3]|uniref:Probable allantoicase n=1 Tax=Mycobacterium pinniadriaticum TaxID=2994102 RepID=A0ABT3SB32_9MYCO|nr:allantoicase [Mycobacterium pinniadriaticum]MCX2929706.1 allantoicase [Mycobacterium pinniadriaticum]MCX2936130.1 allantoicase [Mycobacterium pinniadriaticum]